MKSAFSIPMGNKNNSIPPEIDSEIDNKVYSFSGYNIEEQDLFDSLPALEQQYNDNEPSEEEPEEHDNVIEASLIAPDDETMNVATPVNIDYTTQIMQPLRRSGPPKNILQEFQAQVNALTSNMNVCEICALPLSQKQTIEKMMYIDQISFDDIEQQYNITKQAMMHHTVNCIISNNSVLVPVNSLYRLTIKELLDFTQTLQNFKSTMQIETSPDQMVAYASVVSELRKMIKDIQREKMPQDTAREINKLIIMPLLTRTLKQLIVEVGELKNELYSILGNENNITLNSLIDKFVTKIGIILTEQNAMSQEKLAEKFDVAVSDIN